MDDTTNPLLTPVVRAESAARDRISNAEGSAKNTLRAAREGSEEMVKTSEAAAREEVRQAVEDARRSGEVEGGDIKERIEKDIETMKKKARGRMTQARRVVVERITGA